MGDKTMGANPPRPISMTRRAWMQRGLALGGVAVLGATSRAPALAAPAADAWPTGPVRLVVPFPPGGSVDTVARTVGPQLQAQLGQPVIIENRPGASSVMGAQHVKQSKADGYTILLNASLQVANPVLLTTATYDALNDFVPITEIGAQPQLVVVRADGPYKTMADLVADARQRPRHVTWAIAAFGAAGHLACALVNVQAQVDMPIIPYKGGGPALMDVMGGHVSAQIEPMASAYPHVQAGKLRALAVTSAQRLASLPDVPTVAESGFPGFDMPSWYGLWAPAGTARAIVDKLQAETAKALKVPSVAEKLAAISFIPMGTSPADFAQYSASELEKYRDLINKAHIKADA